MQHQIHATKLKSQFPQIEKSNAKRVNQEGSKETLKNQKTKIQLTERDRRGDSMIKHANAWEMAEKVKRALYMSKVSLERR